jgi:hypothetical protein
VSAPAPSELPSYRGYCYPTEVISYVVWLYYRFSLSLRDVEELLAERGVTVTYETIRAWCAKFGRSYAAGLRRQRARTSDNCAIARRPAPDDNFWRIAAVPGETWSACQRRPDRDRSLVGASTLTLLSDAHNLP